MRFLVFTTLFPNAETPSHGVFVENRLRAFLQKYDADIKVIAPVPWFPSQNKTFGKYAKWARVSEKETRHGVEIYHPRYLIPPKIGMHYAPHALSRCLRRSIAGLTSNGWDFDFIDAHYFFPDGVAAARVAIEIDRPLVITARGADINLIPTFSRARQSILGATHKADAIITVAAALKDELIKLGAPAQKITVLRNGVDLDVFAPMDRQQTRAEMNLSGPVIASIGHLIERKGHHLVIDALRDIPDATLLIAGAGEMRSALAAQVKSLKLGDRVRFLGALPHESLCEIYNAADVLALASSREGWPNVLLEAMACGTPCAATQVWGSGEVIRTPQAGRLIANRNAGAVADAIRNILANPPGRAATRRYAEQHSWEETADGMASIFASLGERRRAGASTKVTPININPSTYTPKLIVTVDTEEQFDWSNFETTDYVVNDTANIDQFQKLCAENKIIPLYFLTYPLLTDPDTVRYFRILRDQGGADCGLHLHQWVTPPLGEFSGKYFSFQMNLPQQHYRSKLHTLAEAFQKGFDSPAIAHRAGRYGIAEADYALLAEIGVGFDFSPSAAFDFSSEGGPDFSSFSNAPFRIATSDKQVFVTPVSGASAIRGTRVFLTQATAAPSLKPHPLRLKSPLKIPMRLSPEGAQLNDLKALTKRLIADRTPILTFTFHSTSLTHDANAHPKDGAGVDHFLETTQQYFRWFREVIGGETISLRELAALYEKAPPSNLP